MNLDVTYEKFKDGRTDLILVLLKSDFSKKDLMAWSAYYGDVTAIRLCLDFGGSLNDLGDNLGLSGAAFHGHWRLCEFLLESGADVNFKDSASGETALHLALCKKWYHKSNRVVSVLLSYGADTTIKTIAGIESGCFMRDVKCVGETCLHRAAAYGSLEVIKLLISKGADRTLLDNHGESSLSWASRHLRSPDILRVLLYGDHAIRDDYKSLEENLLGFPSKTSYH